MITFNNVTYQYAEDEETVLRGVTLSIQQGEYVAVVGRNGSGKSTLARLCNGLFAPTEGTVTVKGLDTTVEENLSEIRQNVGLVFQNPDNQLVATIVDEDVAFGPENIGVPTPEIITRVQEALQKTQCDHLKNRDVHTLSGGQKQRVAIAGALALRPRMLVLDEPTAMLDPQGRREVLEAISELHKSGIGIVLITHFMQETLNAQRIIALDSGEVAFDGTPQAFFEDPARVRQLGLDIPRMLELTSQLRAKGLDIPSYLPKVKDVVKSLVNTGKMRSLEGKAINSPQSRPLQENEDSIIVFDDISHTYMPGTPMEQNALSGVSFEIKRGEALGVIGHTGSGKTTLIQHINGLLFATSGNVRIFDEIITKKTGRNIRKRVGLVFQYPEYQLFEATVRRDIAFGPRNIGVPEEEIEKRVLKAAKAVGLDDNLLEKSPFEISGGQKRRAAIAGVLAMEPDVLILDEPTAGLDPAGREEMLGLVQDLHRQGRTVIMVSHSMEDIARLCGRVLVMNHGGLVADGDVHEVYSRDKELREMGLDVPDMYTLRRLLAENGIAIPPCDSPADCAEALAASLKAVGP